MEKILLGCPGTLKKVKSCVCVSVISSGWGLASSSSCSETVVSAVASQPASARFRLSPLVCHELQCRRTVKTCQGKEEPMQVRCLDARVAVPELSKRARDKESAQRSRRRWGRARQRILVWWESFPLFLGLSALACVSWWLPAWKQLARTTSLLVQ